ncbi:MAG: DUF1801 domain-containing protein, partial [Flavobacteriales bacterium]|nr:DUF1801 domain-containing protein [Flavobacteriales bacterium]
MAQNKTIATNNSVEEFINSVENEQKRKDSLELLKLNEEIIGEPAIMWGSSLIGFGKYHYKYDNGREGDFFVSGFSPRKTALTIYIMSGFNRYDSLMSKLGKFKIGKSCLYVKKLD